MEVSSALRAIESRLAATSEGAVFPPASARLNRREPGVAVAHANAEFDKAVAEIAERQRMLDAGDDSVQQSFSEQRPSDGRPPQEYEPELSQYLSDAPQTYEYAEPLRTGPGDEDVSGLEEQLRALTEELRGLREPGGFEEAIQNLREELAEIRHRLTEAAPESALQALETEVRTLAERVDDGRQHGVDITTITDIEQALSEIRSALQQLAPAESLLAVREEVQALDHRIAALAADEHTEGSGAALEQLRHSIAELRDIASRAASGDALLALREEMQAVSDKVDRLVNVPTASSALSSALEQRFDELAARLDMRSDAAPSVPDRLTALIEQIARKVDRIELDRNSSPLLDAIAKQITRLTEHAEAAETRFDSLDHFERSVRDLLQGMEELRTSAVSAARDAALEVTRQAPPAMEIGELRHDIDTLRRSQLQSERRTQDTLESVRDTLERLVDRLASVEADVHGQHRSPDAARLPLRPVESRETPVFASTGADVERLDNRARLSPADEGPLLLSAAQERRPIDPTLPADHPLEPGTAAARPTLSAAERIAASEAALGGSKPFVEPDAKSNFIAAARRAAQAAANMSAPPDTHAEGKKPARLASLAQKFTGRRSLLLGLILLIGAGTLHLGLDLGSKDFWTEPQLQTAGAISTPVLEQPQAASATRISAAVPPAPIIEATTSIVPPAEQLSSDTSAAPVPAAAARPPETPAIATVSPLTVASAQLPVSDHTSSIRAASESASKSDEGAAKAPAAPAVAVSDELPVSFSKTLREAALTGDPAAEYEVAARYAEARGVALNFEAAARWFARAADRGLAPAQYRLGSLYEKGHGVTKNLYEARRLYHAASERGNAKAMHNLAVLHAEGIDGKPDFVIAAEWFRKAANRGIADSQYNLGILYARGLGVQQNLPESYKWFALAAQQGDTDAGKKRDELATRLDQQALVAARLAAQRFALEPQPEEAATVKTPPGGWDSSTPAKQQMPEKPQKRQRPKPGPGAPLQINPS
ncbi:MAG TPA: hypothetical protein VHG27_06645 [Xanthobacteraceae bacterium]|nr:hypothetical protein [Xanthobacteraceae bacterium]